MKKQKNRRDKRRMKGPGRPLKKTHPRTRTFARVVAVAVMATLAALGVMVLGEAVMLVTPMVTHPVLLGALAALDTGLKVIDVLAKAIALVAFLRALFKDRRPKCR